MAKDWYKLAAFVLFLAFVIVTWVWPHSEVAYVLLGAEAWEFVAYAGYGAFGRALAGIMAGEK